MSKKEGGENPQVQTKKLTLTEARVIGRKVLQTLKIKKQEDIKVRVETEIANFPESKEYKDFIKHLDRKLATLNLKESKKQIAARDKYILSTVYNKGVKSCVIVERSQKVKTDFERVESTRSNTEGKKANSIAAIKKRSIDTFKQKHYLKINDEIVYFTDNGRILTTKKGGEIQDSISIEDIVGDIILEGLNGHLDVQSLINKLVENYSK